MKIILAADHGGVVLKQHILEHLIKRGTTDIIDVGSVEYDGLDDYPDLAQKAATQMKFEDYDARLILFCGSGVGMCIAINKCKGIKAAVCHDTYSAHQGVEHDQMNALCLGERVIGTNLAEEIVEAFLRASHDPGEKYIRRSNKVDALERSQR